MADGRIKIAIEVDGKQINIVADDLKELGAAGQKSGDGVKDAEDGVKGVGNESGKASDNIKKLAKALGLVAIGAAAFKLLSSSMDAAISRFDTLQTFPKVLQELGVSADDSERAMSNLSDGIDGLPTKLDEIAGTAQRMYSSFDDMDKATDSALALNNALLGSGSSAEEAQRGTEQYLKYLQTGKMEMDTWTTLQETMDVGLIKIAESFGYTGRTAKTELYDALKDGTVTMDEFNDKLIEVGTGTGIMAKLAKENSLGIATSWGNLQNAFARGVAGIIEKFNNLSKEVTGNDIAQNIDGMKSVVNASFKVIGNVIDATTPIIKLFAGAIKATIPLVDALTPAILGLLTAYAAYTVITKVSGAIQASNAILAAAQTSTKALTIATNAQVAATLTNTKATKADALATLAKNGAVKLSTVIIGVLTGQMKISTAVMLAKAAAARVLGAAIRFLTGPVGIAVTVIGALATATVALVKWFNRTSEEAEKLKAQTEELGEASDQLNDNLANSTKAYQDQQKEIGATAEANQFLADRIYDLASKENKSAAEKQMLNDYIKQLNESVNDLNLSYDEEANALSMSSEQIANRVGLMEEQASYNAALERQVEIAKEQAEVDQRLEEINELRARSNELYEQESITKRENDKATLELNEQEEALMETKASLAEQQAITEEQLTTSMEAITEATEQGVAGQKLAYEDLSESQQEVVDELKSKWQEYQDAATNMFDVLNDEVEITASEMAANLEENQRIISEWSENIAVLAERGVDEGLLDTLREAGPESAGHVNALVNASDKELERLNDVFSEGGDVATDALAKSLGVENGAVMDAVGDLVVDTEQSLREQVNNAGFDTIGVDLGKGLAGGIKDGTPEAENAATEMADKTTNATRKAFQTRSPSRVYKGIGGDLADGLALGVQRGTLVVLRAVRNMFRGVRAESISQFNSINSDYQRQTNRLRTTMQSQYRSIGLHAMSGLRIGLNAGSGRVMATARSIANNVASTMQKALRIHSPSLVMRDDVGKWVPEGLALGIKDNADSVYRELDKLSSGMLRVSTPEMALGTHRMAYGNPASVSNVHTTQTDRSKSYSPQIVNHFTPAESTPSESARKQKQQMERLALEWGFR